MRFLRNVRVPDQHVLTEADVRPEDHPEREEHLAHVLVVLVRDDVDHAPVPLKEDAGDDQDREPARRRSGEEVDAEHGAEPGR